MFERCNCVFCDFFVGIELVVLKFDDGLMIWLKKNFFDLIFIILIVVLLFLLVMKKDKCKVFEYFVFVVYVGFVCYKIYYFLG